MDSFRDHLDRSLSGSYRIERELGGGGMARVFLAVETALGRHVVVKTLAPELGHDLSAERFAREIRLSARLQHPNIVPVLAAGVAGATPYYTMPFIEGESLRDRLARVAPGERLPPAQAVALLRDVARALSYAHSLGVVHRDIKPANVLLGYDAAMVADFGVAKAVAAARTQAVESGNPALTQTGVALGTPAYMAPEQATGAPATDHRADLYAWGVMAYEVLAGAHPFADSGSVQAVLVAHLTEEPKPLGEAAPDVPEAVSVLVMRCLAKNAADRPGDAGEIVDVLGSAAAADSGPTHRRDGAGWWHSRRSAIALAGAAAVILTGLGVAYGLRGRQDTAGAAAQRPVTASPGYDAYLRGRVRVGSENAEDIAAAIAAFRQAIAADSLLAPAHAALARAYTIKGFYFAADSEKKRLTEDAEVEVERAFALDPRSAEGWFARGLMLWTPERRFPHEQAVRAYRQALQLDPGMDEAHHRIALVYMHVGLLDRARTEIDSALAINPGNTLARFRLGLVDLYQGRYEAAYAIFNSTPLDRNPALWGFQTATALFRLGREREATDLIDTYLRDYPRDESGVGNSVRAMMLARAGRRVEAEAAIAEAVTRGRGYGHFHHTAYNVASAYALLGERAQAIRWLQTAADDGFPCYPLFAADEQLASLRGDPAFIALITRLERDWAERNRTL